MWYQGSFFILFRFIEQRLTAAAHSAQCSGVSVVTVRMIATLSRPEATLSRPEADPGPGPQLD